MKCASATCRFHTWRDRTLCRAHSAQQGDPEARAELRAQSARANARKAVVQLSKGRRRALPARKRIPSGPLPEIGAWLLENMIRPVGLVFLAIARAIYGTLTTDDLPAFRKVVRWRAWPRMAGYVEALILAGRRAGKSSFAAALGIFEAVVMGAKHMAHLPHGTRGHVLVVSRTVKQAAETFRYARAMCEAHFAAQLIHATEGQGGELHFDNGIVLSVGVASASSLRGFTVVAAIVDEAAHLGGAEESERDLDEILSTLRMAMLSPVGAPPRRLLTISSPGVKQGPIYEACERFADDPTAPLLVARGPSFVWNDSLDPVQLERERERDPRRYQREVLAEFVGAINPLLDDDAIDRAAQGRSADPLAPTTHNRVAAVDIGLRRDSTALTLAHIEEMPDGLPRVVVDGLWRWSPKPGQPLDIADVVSEIVEVLDRYGVSRLVADQFSFDAVKIMFAARGVQLVEHSWSQQSKVQRFGVLRDLLVDGRISLPKHERLLAELRSLDEQILPSGTIRIAARGRQHDDAAFACCLAVSEAILSAPRRGGAFLYDEIDLS